MGWFLTKSRIWETLALLVIAFALFRPGFFMNQIQPPFIDIEPAGFSEALANAAPGSTLRAIISGPDFDTLEVKDVTVPLTVPDVDGAEARLEALGMILVPEGDVQRIGRTELWHGLGRHACRRLTSTATTRWRSPAYRPPPTSLPKELIFIPALMLLALVAFLQTRRAPPTTREEQPA